MCFLSYHSNNTDGARVYFVGGFILLAMALDRVVEKVYGTKKL